MAYYTCSVFEEFGHCCCNNLKTAFSAGGFSASLSSVLAEQFLNLDSFLLLKCREFEAISRSVGQPLMVDRASSTYKQIKGKGSVA